MTVGHEVATAAVARGHHPCVHHGGISFLGQILLVVSVPLVDRGKRHCPEQMFALAIAISALTVLLLGHRPPCWIDFIRLKFSTLSTAGDGDLAPIGR